MKRKLILPVIMLALMSGCASQKSLYYWGEYEKVILDMYTAPGSADTYTQIEKLTRTIQQAQAQGRSIPPGLHAHLGMIYAKHGDPGLAIEAFEEEKRLYPESSVFIDGMLSRAKKGAKR
jgi:hypothetical protein